MSETEDLNFDFEKIDRSTLSPVAEPLASKKLHSRIFKLVKKANKNKALKRGVKEVVKSIKKGQKGMVFLAADVSPLDVISHLPILCEESDIAYCYIISKAGLSQASSTKRSTSCVMIPAPKKDDDLYKYYDKCIKEIKN